MKLCFIRLFASYYDAPFRRAFQKLGWEICEKTYYTPKDPYCDAPLMERIQTDLKDGGYDAVLTVNFWPLLAKVLSEGEIPYVSWSYDAPQNLPTTEEMEHENNYIFLFDRLEVERYRKMGITRVFHLPLAVDTEEWKRVTEAYYTFGQLPKASYASEVSLVGSLYQSTYPAIRESLGGYEARLLKGFCDAQMKLFGCYMIPELLTEETMEVIRRGFGEESPFQGITSRQLSYSIATYLTFLDRHLLLRLFAQRYDTALFTFQKADEIREMLPKVRVEESVDYSSQMPQVFAASKINLCPTLRCIGSGIPLRALDVMGCGGFLLVPLQPELMEYFVPNQDAGIYSTLEEAVELAEYYLSHEEQRKAVAASGQRKVQAAFRMEDRLQQMMDYVMSH